MQRIDSMILIPRRKIGTKSNREVCREKGRNLMRGILKTIEDNSPSNHSISRDNTMVENKSKGLVQEMRSDQSKESRLNAKNLNIEIITKIESKRVIAIIKNTKIEKAIRVKRTIKVSINPEIETNNHNKSIIRIVIPPKISTKAKDMKLNTPVINTRAEEKRALSMDLEIIIIKKLNDLTISIGPRIKKDPKKGNILDQNLPKTKEKVKDHKMKMISSKGTNSKTLKDNTRTWTLAMPFKFRIKRNRTPKCTIPTIL